MTRRPLRHAAVLLHRWVGLGIAAFLLVTSLTGSLIAFYDEIESSLLPGLMRVPPPAPGAPMIDALRLREMVAARHPQASINWVDLYRQPGRTQVFGLSSVAGAAPLPNDEVFIDPYTGDIVGQRRHGDLRQGLRNLMPFVYELHEALALGEFGGTVLGIAALLWTIDCFVGLYLTLPLRRLAAGAGGSRARRPVADWLRRWLPAWRVRLGASVPKVMFDWHCALSLWAWAALLVLAWSAVAFNLPSVYQPVMRLFGYQADAEPHAERQQANAAVLPWADALSQARDLMATQSAAGGFVVLRERSLSHDPARGLYQYRTLSTLDVGRKLGNTTLFFDDRSGRLAAVSWPTGRTIANTLDTWIVNLHTATVGGLAMQIVVCAAGIVIAIVTLSGVDIWRRRRAARHIAR